MSKVELKRRLERSVEIKKLLDLFLMDAIEKVGFEPNDNAELTINLRAQSGYESKTTYQKISSLQWVLVQSILESDLGKKKEKPKSQPDTKKYPLFNLFPNKKATS